MATFFTSDLHLGHRLMVNKERHTSPFRNYNDVDEMDADIIRRWCRQVQPSDTVYILGDFSFRRANETRSILHALNGRKVLVKGNHDHREKSNPYSQVEYADALDEFHIYLERKFIIGGKEEQLICMLHFPMMHWHKQHYGSWHLHGHLHGNPSGVTGKCLDVGWDKHGKLLSLQDVAEIMSTKTVRGNHHTEEH